MLDTDGIELIKILADRGCTASIIMVSSCNKNLLSAAGELAVLNGLDLRGTITKSIDLDKIKALLRESIYGGTAEDGNHI